MSKRPNRLDADDPRIRVHGRIPFQDRGTPADVWFFRKWDQITLWAILFLTMSSLTAYWGYQRYLGEGSIEFESMEFQEADFQLDINQATWAEFAVLPGIGEEKARGIVQYRETNGPFADISDLQRVKGIGPKIMDQVRPYVYSIPDVETTALK